jgi:hypothetical protein
VLGAAERDLGNPERDQRPLGAVVDQFLLLGFAQKGRGRSSRRRELEGRLSGLQERRRQLQSLGLGRGAVGSASDRRAVALVVLDAAAATRRSEGLGRRRGGGRGLVGFPAPRCADNLRNVHIWTQILQRRRLSFRGSAENLRGRVHIRTQIFQRRWLSTWVAVSLRRRLRRVENGLIGLVSEGVVVPVALIGASEVSRHSRRWTVVNVETREQVHAGRVEGEA